MTELLLLLMLSARQAGEHIGTATISAAVKATTPATPDDPKPTAEANGEGTAASLWGNDSLFWCPRDNQDPRCYGPVFVPDEDNPGEVRRAPELESTPAERIRCTPVCPAPAPAPAP